MDFQELAPILPRSGWPFRHKNRAVWRL